MKTPICHLPALIFSSVACFALLAWSAPPASPASEAPKSIPLDQIGTEAAKQYRGSGLTVAPTAEGAELRCAFQNLTGRVTAQGLWLQSMEKGSADAPFRLVAQSVGRELSATAALPAVGTVEVAEKIARLHRPDLTEEYTTSVDGIRQDFVVPQAPAGTQALRVELALTGAEARSTNSGALLVLPGSGRELAYTRLVASDAKGAPLMARLEVVSAHRLAITVQDAGATYPVRIDPTFSDADWVSMGSLDPWGGGEINAMATDAAGHIYAGGSALPGGIAKWDGTSWKALGEGVNGTVQALALHGNDLYVGGGSSWYSGGTAITMAGGIPVKGIAKYNVLTGAWSALGAGVDGSVNALAFRDGELYAGGDFRYVNAVTRYSNLLQFNADG
ncbi:MAG: hypothetical protein ACOYMN_22060, partial [Roseimicrobium sp.]